ncbi:MAG: N-formylglutamate amidohydrolase [Pseudomonadota bacterium]
MVARIVKENYPGHEVSRPSVWRHPLIFMSPHSGRDYPRRLLGQSPLPLATMRRSEDAYVDRLIPDYVKQMVPVLNARFPRLFVDVNRSPRELDPALFAGALDNATESKSNRVLAGFGVIPKLAADGRNIYPGRLSSHEARMRLKNCYHPYHAALQGLIDEAKRRFGHVVLIDWHSMPSTASVTGRLPDIVLGDLFGEACTAQEIAMVEEAFVDEDFDVVRNTPYAGGFVAAHYGKPDAGVSVIQVEMNRGLYLDERRVARARSFQDFGSRIERVIDRLILGASPAAVAAE